MESLPEREQFYAALDARCALLTTIVMMHPERMPAPVLRGTAGSTLGQLPPLPPNAGECGLSPHVAERINTAVANMLSCGMWLMEDVPIDPSTVAQPQWQRFIHNVSQPKAFPNLPPPPQKNLFPTYENWAPAEPWTPITTTAETTNAKPVAAVRPTTLPVIGFSDMPPPAQQQVSLAEGWAEIINSSEYVECCKMLCEYGREVGMKLWYNGSAQDSIDSTLCLFIDDLELAVDVFSMPQGFYRPTKLIPQLTELSKSLDQAHVEMEAETASTQLLAQAPQSLEEEMDTLRQTPSATTTPISSEISLERVEAVPPPISPDPQSETLKFTDVDCCSPDCKCDDCLKIRSSKLFENSDSDGEKQVGRVQHHDACEGKPVLECGEGADADVEDSDSDSDCEKLSEGIESVHVNRCDLPPHFWRYKRVQGGDSKHLRYTFTRHPDLASMKDQRAASADYSDGVTGV